jgi:porin
MGPFRNDSADHRIASYTRQVVAVACLLGSLFAPGIARSDDSNGSAIGEYCEDWIHLGDLFAGCEGPSFLGCDDLATRTQLGGDLGGLRTGLGAHGIALNLSTTQFYQGVTSGGITPGFQYNGRNDYYMNVDGEKAGLWKGFFVTLHGETRYGDDVNFNTGAIMPVNTAALFPAPVGSPTALTAVKLTQALSEDFITFAGKINMLDELKQNYAAGRGVDAFMNLGLTLPVIAARTVPYSTLGAGFAVLNEMQPVFTFMVLDTNNTPTTSGFQTLFNNGATMIARLEKPVTIWDRPGHQAIWGTYSTGTYNDLSPTPYFSPDYGLTFLTGTQTGSWSMIYSADQALYVDPQNAQRSWGLFTNIGLADNGPSPIRWSANVGLGGSSPLVSRKLDTFGIGYSFVNYSSPVQNAAPRLLPVRDDHAVELFYNYAITPWFRVTPDLQILVPAREQTLAILPENRQSIDTTVVVGVRAKLDF